MDRFDDVQLVASTPGRIRIGIGSLYRAPELAGRLEAELARHPAIREVHASVLTARVLVLFDPEVNGETLLVELGFEKAQAGRAGPGMAAARAEMAGPGGAAVRHTPIYAPWHLRSPQEALAFHGTAAERGLTQAEADQRLRHGLNAIPMAPRASNLEILLNQFKSMPVILLGVSAVLSVLTGALADAAAIAAVLAVNGAIGYVTEKQAEATIASLSELVDDTVLSLRDGQVRRIEATHVVPGDILVLHPGTRIAADLRLLQANGLMIDESPLTGESFPVTKSVAAQDSPTPLAERSNMAYRGTAVSMGTGLGLVVGTGSRTEAGAIDTLTKATERPKTRTQTQLDTLVEQLVMVSSTMCLGIFGLGLLRGYPRLAMFKTAAALAIAAVPEGLPAVATTSFARGIRRMREQYVLIRHLHAVETLGAIQTICLDKTGTLTMNQMSVTAARSARHTLDGQPAAGKLPDDAAAELDRLLQVVVLCNEAAADRGLPDSTLQGSATENALLRLAERNGVEPELLRQRFALLSTDLRAEGRNYMRTVHAIPGSDERFIAVKGSPEEVLAMCGAWLDGPEARGLDEATRNAIMEQNREMAARQLRVLGIAYAQRRAAPGDTGPGLPSLTWVGLVGLADPLRPGVVRVIERFHEAGIRTVMLTGDQAGTAYEIGRALNLNHGEDLYIVNSDELAHTPGAQLPELAARADIFARVTPSDKLRIVKALQASGTTVAMTGDGINDSPALRAADIGIAMGGGTEVALSVADVALQYDQLEAVLDAVSQGRMVAANTRKAVHFLVSSNLSEILVVFGGVALGHRQPLSPFQLLWLNLLTDMLPAVALAAEPAEEDLMRRVPRDPAQQLIQGEDILHYSREAGVLAAGTLGAYAVGTLRHGPGGGANTIRFDTLVLGQLLHALFCRTERHSSLDRKTPPSRELVVSLAASLGLHGLGHVVPRLRQLLGIAPLDLLDWVIILLGAGAPLLVNELARPRRQSSAATSASAERSNSRSTTAPTTLSPRPSLTVTRTGSA